MDKFRKIWFGIVIAAVGLMLIYQLVKTIKKDSAGPVIQCDKETITVSIEDPESALLKGVTARDKKDGDLTDSILVEKLSGLYDGNKRTVTYVAFDSDNHISKLERKVIYSDYTSPRFALSGSLRFRTGETVDINKIVSVEDCIDGKLTNKVKIMMDATINSRLPGVYNLTYEVTNSAGDTQKLPVQVEIYETNRNEIDLNLSTYLIYYDGTVPAYKDYLKSVKSGSIEYFFEGATPNTAEAISKDRVTVDPRVNYEVPGVYPVYFYYENQGSIYTHGTEVMYVVVQ